jgi:hypothetical protein
MDPFSFIIYGVTIEVIGVEARVPHEEDPEMGSK